MATYSAFFSSGLLAPRTTDAYDDTSDVDVDDRSVTPMPVLAHRPSLSQSSHHTQSSSNSNGQAKTLRKRRSSLSIAQSALKSPARAAYRAAMSPSRSRSGSVSSVYQAQTQAGETIEQRMNAGVVGRARSGSVGTALRSKRLSATTTKHRPAPSLPAPNVPLPPLPPMFNLQPIAGSPNKDKFKDRDVFGTGVAREPMRDVTMNE